MTAMATSHGPMNLIGTPPRRPFAVGTSWNMEDHDIDAARFSPIFRGARDQSFRLSDGSAGDSGGAGGGGEGGAIGGTG